ncbi:hypothetical protein OKW44_004400 [Paraburkholderia sp. WSM4174]
MKCSGLSVVCVLSKYAKLPVPQFHRAHRHAYFAGINPVEITQRLERGLQRRGVVVARQLRRTGHSGQRRWETRHEKALLPFDDRAHCLRCRKCLAHRFARIEQQVFDRSWQGRPERRLADRLPELQQTLDASFRWIARNDRRIQCTDRDARDPVRFDAGFVKSLKDAGLIGAERAAALQHQRDGFVVGQPGMPARAGGDRRTRALPVARHAHARPLQIALRHGRPLSACTSRGSRRTTGRSEPRSGTLTGTARSARRLQPS